MTGTTRLVLGLGLTLTSLALLLLDLRRLGNVRVPVWGRWPRPRSLMYAWVPLGAMGLILLVSTYPQLLVLGGAWLLLVLGAVAWHNYHVRADVI